MTHSAISRSDGIEAADSSPLASANKARNLFRREANFPKLGKMNPV
jgi:hypothetical protein